MDLGARAREEVARLSDHQSYVMGVLRKRLPHALHGDLLDLTHDVFERALRWLRQHPTPIDNPKAWLATIAVNVASDVRKAPRLPLAATPVEVLRQVAAEEDPETRVNLIELCRLLESDQTLRDLVDHGPLNDLTIRELSRVLRVGRNAKGARMMARFRGILADLGVDIGRRWQRPVATARAQKETGSEKPVPNSEAASSSPPEPPSRDGSRAARAEEE